MGEKSIEPVIGAIIGDVLGSIYEWHNAKEYDKIEMKFEKPCHFTDDTVLTCAVADWIAESKGGKSENQREILEQKLDEYGKAFPRAGYGHIFREWLAAEKKEPMNSYGNGAGMRVSPCACAVDGHTEVLFLARHSAEVTHNHYEGIRGAQALSVAIQLLLQGNEKAVVKAAIEYEFGYDLIRKVDDIRGTHGFDATCQVTVPEAIIAFLEGNSFDEVFKKAIWLGGDSDTIADMACALAAAHYGLPEGYEEAVRKMLPEKLNSAIDKFKTYIENGTE